jgi:hypothetical protein
MIWFIIIAIAVMIGFLHVAEGMRGGALIQLAASHTPFYENFASDTEIQHRLLGLEEERRYNPMARVQAARINPNTIAAALSTQAAVPTAATNSMLTLLGSNMLIGADDGAGKRGTVEDTGVVQQKINFCESMPVNCDAFSDPRFAECGFCHRDGTDHKGEPHRGGMFISAEDQIRANEVSKATGRRAVYKPSIGTCKPGDFTLVKEACVAREHRLECQRAGAATSANACGQCFGVSSGRETGLLYVGPKPRAFKAMLIVSGGDVTVNGAAITGPLELTEGQTLTITIKNVPEYWCGWFASGQRIVSVDIAEQSVSDPNFAIVGDSRTRVVAEYLAQKPMSVPNSVLWYGRYKDMAEVTLNCVMPATLVDPNYEEDQEHCPTGPLVFTERGAGIMGANSCFNPDGSFSAGLVCIQRMFRAAGGTDKGTLYPRTAEAARALARATIDETMNYFNERANIAIYRVNNANVPQDLETVKVAALEMLGIYIVNPCDGPKAATGPHSAECLDYLWRTSGDASRDGVKEDHSKLPYAYCGKEGTAAPMNQDGSVNHGNANAANSLGNIPAIRAYFNGFFNRTHDTKFDVQAAAMRECYGANIRPPPADARDCPAPNPTDFQCFGPSKLAKPEVYAILPGGGYNALKSEGNAICARFNGRMATHEELADAQMRGADWCATAWVRDRSNPEYPITTNTMSGCGNGRTGIMSWNPGGENADSRAGINCIGKKPAPGSVDVLPFSASRWHDPSVLPPGVSETSVPIVVHRNGGMNVVMSGWGSSNILYMNSEAECDTVAAKLNKDPSQGALHGRGMGHDALLNQAEQYLRERV